MRHRILRYIASVLLLWAGGVNACAILGHVERPDIKKDARTADIVAIIHVDQVEWRTSEEKAEFRRLWERPPMGVAFSYPFLSARFSVQRILKGQIPDGVLIRSSSTNCGVVLRAGVDYVLVASLPSEDDDRIQPWSTTFPLDANPYSATKLAEVESLFTHSNTSSP